MDNDIKIVSKVLVHETDSQQTEKLKTFFLDNNLVGLKAEHNNNIRETLKTNIDLGAIFLCEDIDKDGKSGVDIVSEVHKLRTELPIFLRRSSSKNLDDLPQVVKRACAGAYNAHDHNSLKSLIDKFIFNTYYPSSFIRGIKELSVNALAGIFKDIQLTTSTPYLIRDRLIYGELFSIMALEGNWCRGYMMLQADEFHMAQMIMNNKTPLPSEDTDFRSVNNLMSELTNMIWGRFKSRFFASDDESKIIHRTQVPIIVNHDRKYITLGSEDPQLCFKYTFNDPEGKVEPINLYQKFAFNLVWSPDEFIDSPHVIEELVETGQLELF